MIIIWYDLQPFRLSLHPRKIHFVSLKLELKVSHSMLKLLIFNEKWKLTRNTKTNHIDLRIIIPWGSYSWSEPWCTGKPNHHTPPLLSAYHVHLRHVQIISIAMSVSKISINVQVYRTIRFVHTTLVNPLRRSVPMSFPNGSFIVQQRLPLPISADNITLFPQSQLLSKSTRNSDNQGGDE